VLNRFKPWWVGFLLCGLFAGVAAQDALRREVGGPLQSAQEAIKAQKPIEALGLLNPVRALSDLTEPERFYLERVTAAAALQAKRYDVALVALEYVVQSPSLPAAERKSYLETLVGASIQAQDYPRVVNWARKALEAGADAARFQLSLTQALALQGRHADVVSEMARIQRESDAAGRTITEAQWRVLGASQLKLKDATGYYATLLQLLRVAPSKDYWADLLPRVSQQPDFNARLELDVYRLVQATDNLEDASDFLEMAKLAIKAGLPAFGVRVLEQGLAQKALTTAQTDALLIQARKRATEDEQSLPQLRAAARDANSWAQLGDLYASAQRWQEAHQAYAKALAEGALRRPDEVRLHYAISLAQAGQRGLAREVLTQVGGDAMPLAKLWQLFLSNDK
jgi:hypothetical protein